MSQLFLGCTEREINTDKLLTRKGIAYAVNSDDPFTGIAYDYYFFTKGVKSKVRFKNGKKHGTYIMFHDNGQKREQGQYNKDILDGGVETWYANGQQKAERKYENGKGVGLWVSWYKKGQLEEEILYKVGKRDGKGTRWFENGQKEWEIPYKDGKRDGRVSGWFENGKKKGVNFWKEGNKVGQWTSWYSNGRKKHEACWKDGKKEGSRYYRNNGKINSEEYYKNGMKYPYITAQYSHRTNGRIKRRCSSRGRTIDCPARSPLPCQP